MRSFAAVHSSFNGSDMSLDSKWVSKSSVYLVAASEIEDSQPLMYGEGQTCNIKRHFTRG